MKYAIVPSSLVISSGYLLKPSLFLGPSGPEAALEVKLSKIAVVKALNRLRRAKKAWNMVKDKPEGLVAVNEYWRSREYLSHAD
jgi:hypothetical protein